MWRRCFVVLIAFNPFAAMSVEPVPEHINQLLRTRQYDEAIGALDRLAQRDHAGALALMAKLYRVGRGVEKDPGRALELLERAANQGDPESQLLLGRLLAERADSSDSLDRASEWIEKAKDQGYPGAAEALVLVRNKTIVGRLEEEDEAPTSFVPAGVDRAAFLVGLAARGDLSGVDKALRSGISPRSRDEHGWTALSAAVRARSIEIVDLLIRAGIDIDAPLPGANTAMLIAVKERAADVAVRLVSAGANVDAIDDAGNSALLYAVRGGPHGVVEALIRAGADVNAIDELGRSVLDNARLAGDESLVTALLAVGAKPSHERRLARERSEATITRDARHGSESESIFRFIRQANAELLETVLTGGASVIARDAEGYTPLGLAVMIEALQCVEVLLRHGAPVDAPDDDGFTPVHRAIQVDSGDILQLLLESASPSAVSVWRDYPLHYAIRIGRSERAIQLVEQGYAPMFADPNGHTAPVIAARHGEVGLLRYFLDHGIDPSATGVSGRSLLRHAIEANQPAVVEFLAAGGFTGDLSAEEASQLLLTASKHADPRLLRSLVEAGADVDVYDDAGITPLMATTAADCAPCVDYLAARGANLDARDRLGNTALHVAALNGSIQAAMRLIAAGANQKILNDAGESHLSIVEDTGFGNRRK